jgi:hypothetical protein
MAGGLSGDLFLIFLAPEFLPSYLIAAQTPGAEIFSCPPPDRAPKKRMVPKWILIGEF